jgi:ATP-dependent RNA helicase SUPV3L1/SUV3
MLQWRNRSLDFSTLENLKESLRAMPREQRMVRARMADDVAALETVSADKEIAGMARAPASVAKLWDVCQIPDYSKISGQSHAELVASVYKFLMSSDERIPEDWFSKQVERADRTDGDIDTLANRIAHIRTWTFVSNRADWLNDPGHWQSRAREIEDKLSDAMHERLTQRFVDLRTSALMKGMREKDELHAEIAEDGTICVENHYVGKLKGFRFSQDDGGEGVHGKATRNAAAQVLARELAMRARRVAAAQPDAIRLTRSGHILWKDEEIGQIEATDDPLKPSLRLLTDEHLSALDHDKIAVRLECWLSQTIADKLKPLVEIGKAEDISGLARGIGFRLRENFGILKRDTVADEIKSLDQTARAPLRKYGVRFGAFNVYIPLLLKPASAELALTLWSLQNASTTGMSLEALPEPPRAGLTSFAPDSETPETFYRACGYHVCGSRAVRLDMLERLADLIRSLLSWRAKSDDENTQPPRGATGDGGFTVTPEMMSILGCSPDELSGVLKELGFCVERRPLQRADDTAADSAPATTISFAAGEAPTAVVAEPAKTEATDRPNEPPAAGEAPAEAAEPQSEEVWRPRRHQRSQRRKDAANRARTRFQDKAAARGQASGRAEATGADGNDQTKPAASGDERPEGRRNRAKNSPNRSRDSHHRRPKGGERRVRDERRAPEVISAGPQRKGGTDPDSPFAALGELRAALEKRGKESSS